MLSVSALRRSRSKLIHLNRLCSSSVASENVFLTSTNSVYMEQMHEQWQRDPSSVHASWSSYFSNLESGMPASSSFSNPPSIQVGQTKSSFVGATQSNDGTKCLHMIYAFQENGHKIADLDPLSLSNIESIDILDPKFYGFSDSDYDRPLDLAGFGIENVEGVMKNSDLNHDGSTTLGELHSFLMMTYCGKVGYEYAHVPENDRKNFIRSKIEVVHDIPSKETTLNTLERLARADKFERFLGTKFNTAKRFGLEGCDSMIPGLIELVDTCVHHGDVNDVVIGMPHRGRLNVLANVVQKPMEIIFQEFQGIRSEDDDYSGSGDVKYHLGIYLSLSLSFSLM